MKSQSTHNMHKKAQFWYSDFLIAILILVGISFLFIRNITDLNSDQDKLQSLSSDSVLISNAFMSQGYCPSSPNDCLTDWQQSNMGRIGLVKDSKVVQENIEALISLTSTEQGYQKSKALIGTRNNYIFYFENSDDLNTKIEIKDELGVILGTIFGNPSVNDISQINARSFIKTTRLVYLSNNDNTNRIVKLITIIW